MSIKVKVESSTAKASPEKQGDNKEKTVNPEVIQDIKTIDSAAKLSPILSVFESKGKKVDKKLLIKILNSIAKTAIEITNKSISIPVGVSNGLNLDFYYRLFNSDNFESIKADIKNIDNIYNKKILELMNWVDQKIIKNRELKSSRDSEINDAEQKQRRVNLIKKAMIIKESKKIIKPKRNASPFESDVKMAAGPEQYMQTGQIYSGERLLLPKSIFDNVAPASISWVMKDQIMSCINSVYGVVTNEEKMNTSASEMEKGICDYVLKFYQNSEQSDNTTSVKSMVKFPTFSKPDSNLKVDVASLRLDVNTTPNQLKLLEIFLFLSNRIYPYSNDKILQQSMIETPKTATELINTIGVLSSNNSKDLVDTLTEYLAVTKDLKEKINICTLELLVKNDEEFDIQVIEKLMNKSENQQELSAITQSYFESITLLKKLEKYLITDQKTKIEMHGVQIKTSARAAEKHLEINGGVPVAIGNTSQGLNTIEKSNSPIAKSYIESLKKMCKDLF
jgi:hypothetical protein